MESAGTFCLEDLWNNEYFNEIMTILLNEDSSNTW